LWIWSWPPLYIYEIKDRAEMSALGQLLTYEALYREEYEPKKPIKKVVIADRLGPSMARIFRRFNIEAVEV